MIGYREIHSADERDYIYHVAERRWVIVWRDRRLNPVCQTRDYARANIRFLKGFRPGTQLRLNLTKEPTMPIDPKTLPHMSELEFKNLTKGRRQQATEDYQFRTGCTAEEASAVAEHWSALSKGKT